MNAFKIKSDSQRTLILASLDLTAAIDTVVHDILIQRLQVSVGLAVPVSWLSCFYVSVGSFKCVVTKILSGVPQRLVLAPLLFNLHVLPLGIIDMHTAHGCSSVFPPMILVALTYSLASCCWSDEMYHYCEVKLKNLLKCKESIVR